MEDWQEIVEPLKKGGDFDVKVAVDGKVPLVLLDVDDIVGSYHTIKEGPIHHFVEKSPSII